MHTGSATSNIAKLAAASYRTAYAEFGNALNIIYANSNAEKEAFDVVSKELSDSADIFKKMGKELQIVIPRKGAYERFSLSEDIVRYLVLSLVHPGKKMTFDSFLQVLYDHYLSLIHISEPTRRTPISYAVFCLKKKKTTYLLYTYPNLLIQYHQLTHQF